MTTQEVWQEYDYQGQPLQNGGIKSAAEARQKITGGIIVILVRKRGDGVEFLLQKRSQDLEVMPGQWDVSAGGHINYGETFVQAGVRKAQEELGVNLDAQKLYYGFSLNEGLNICQVFFYNWDAQIDNFNFQNEQVTETHWLPLDTFEDFCQHEPEVAKVLETPMVQLIVKWLRAYHQNIV